MFRFKGNIEAEGGLKRNAALKIYTFTTRNLYVRFVSNLFEEL